ncbi:MAG: ribonuclease H [Patescibacteria group bacterium]
MKNTEIKIYTDGAAKGNPGSAGWAAVVLLSQNSGEPRVLVEIGGRKDHATNNQMELTAPIEALKYLKKISARQGLAEIEIVSDSKYVILGITEWIFNWQKNNWRNAAKKPVMNKGLWEELYALTQELKPKWTYVKGHNEDVYNDRADLIATSFAEGEPVKLINER